MPLLPAPLSPEERRQVSRAIMDLSAPRRSFYMLVVISTTIAAYGLLANSTAVVIGAMLVAPLMGPIFGVALALCTGNRRLLAMSLGAEVLGVLLAVGIGLAIGLVPLRPSFGMEILGRTQPTIYDIFIALASGFAGAYSLVNPKLNPALAGVAIATALVPPLATCGLCLSGAEWGLASGAFLLFFANFLSIHLAAAGVFGSVGLARIDGDSTLRWRVLVRRFGVSTFALTGVGVFMTQTLIKIVAERQLQSRVHTVISREVGTISGAYVSDVRLVTAKAPLEIIADVTTPQAFEPAQVQAVERTLAKEVGTDLHLVIRSLLARDTDRSGPVFLPENERLRQQEAAEQARTLQQITDTVGRELQAVPGARLVDIRRDNATDGAAGTVVALVRTPSAVTPAQVAVMEKSLVTALGRPIHLVVRSVLTRDADADRYVYDTVSSPVQRDFAEEALRETIEAALRDLLRDAGPGRSLSELRMERVGGRIKLLALIRTPRNIEPPLVAVLQGGLRDRAAPEIDLVVRSVVGTDSGPDGYRSGDDPLEP